jgi:hypothetical protein
VSLGQSLRRIRDVPCAQGGCLVDHAGIEVRSWMVAASLLLGDPFRWVTPRGGGLTLSFGLFWIVVRIAPTNAHHVVCLKRIATYGASVAKI